MLVGILMAVLSPMLAIRRLVGFLTKHDVGTFGVNAKHRAAHANSYFASIDADSPLHWVF